MKAYVITWYSRELNVRGCFGDSASSILILRLIMYNLVTALLSVALQVIIRELILS